MHPLIRNDNHQADAGERGSSANATSSSPPGNFTADSIDLTTRSEFLAADKQLAQYFKKASTMNWPLFLVLLSSTFCDKEHHHSVPFRFASSASLFLNLLPLFVAGWMDEKGLPEPSEDSALDNEIVDPWDRRRILVLCILAYLSNFSLTVTAISFTMFFRAGYVWFFFMLVLLILPYLFVFKNGMDNGITWGIVQYKELHPDMDFFFSLCSEITQTNFTALSATLFGYLKRGQCMDVPYRAPEIILLIAVIIGIFVMTMCTVPPAAGLPGYRDSFVRDFLKFIIYGLLALTSVGLFLAVLKICGRSVYLSLIIVLVDLILCLGPIIVAGSKRLAAWCVEESTKPMHAGLQDLGASSEVGNTSQRAVELSTTGERLTQQTSQLAPPRAADEQSLLLASLYSIMSGALMVSYSLDVTVRKKGYKASLVIIYSAIVAYLGMVIITRETKKKPVAVLVSRIIAAILLIAALICVIVFILSNPLSFRSSQT